MLAMCVFSATVRMFSGASIDFASSPGLLISCKIIITERRQLDEVIALDIFLLIKIID